MRLLPAEEHQDKAAITKQMRKSVVDDKDAQNVFIDSVHKSFLLEDDSKIIGFCEVELEEECFPPEDFPQICLKLHAFHIEPENRDKCITAAFKLLRQWGRDNKAALIETEVNAVLEFTPEFLTEQRLDLVGSGQKAVYRGFI